MAAAGLAAAILTGCSHSADEPVVEADCPLLLAADSQASRAATPLAGTHSDFGVWAWKADDAANLSMVLSRSTEAAAKTEYYTRYEADAWTYEYSDASARQYIRYWDRAAADYYFAAYAPYKVAGNPVNDSHTITATKDGVSISAVSAAAGIDWLEARWQRHFKPLYDLDLITDEFHTTVLFSSVVPLVFHHLLAVTEFRVYSDSDVILGSISITIGGNIYTLADYSAGTWAYTEPSTPDIFSATPNLDLAGTSKTEYRPLATLFQIPQDVNGRTVTVEATLSDSSRRSGTFILDEGWDGEKKYIYYLCIKSGEIILADFHAVDWTDGGAIDVIDPVVNW